MIGQLLIGAVIISLTVLIVAVFVGVVGWALQKAGPWLVVPPLRWKFVATLSLVVLWIQLAVSVCVWIWALVFMGLDIFPEVESAVYFSIVAFTTLGFGDVLLPEEWRLLSGLAASNGLLMFGFMTAFLVETMRRIRKDQLRGRPEEP